MQQPNADAKESPGFSRGENVNMKYLKELPGPVLFDQQVLKSGETKQLVFKFVADFAPFSFGGIKIELENNTFADFDEFYGNYVKCADCGEHRGTFSSLNRICDEKSDDEAVSPCSKCGSTDVEYIHNEPFVSLYLCNVLYMQVPCNRIPVGSSSDFFQSKIGFRNLLLTPAQKPRIVLEWSKRAPIVSDGVKVTFYMIGSR